MRWKFAGGHQLVRSQPMLTKDALDKPGALPVRTNRLPNNMKATPMPSSNEGMTTPIGMKRSRRLGGGVATPAGVRHNRKERGTAATATAIVTASHLRRSGTV